MLDAADAGGFHEAQSSKWHKNPAWWAIAIAIVSMIGTVFYNVFGEALGGWVGIQGRVGKVENRLEYVEKIGKQAEELVVRLQSQIADLEGEKRSIEVLKRDLIPFAKGEVLPYRPEDRDRLIAAAREIGVANRQIEMLDQLTVMHTQQLNAIREMLKSFR